MANSIELSKSFVPLLDEVYKENSLTDVLTSDKGLAREGANANEIEIPTLDMDGLSDYDRNAGYSTGSVTQKWETLKYNYDRGKKFTVDSMDNEESANIAFGRLASEFVRTKVVPEADAFTFAKLCELAGLKVSTGANLADGSKVMDAIKVAEDSMNDAEVSQENRYLFITSSNLTAIQALDTTKSRELLGNFAGIIRVPKGRFVTAIDLNDGGYAKNTEAKDINFMIVQKDAVIKYDKHVVSNIITPDANQTADAWMLKYRKYGLVSVFENKKNGIYVHFGA